MSATQKDAADRFQINDLIVEAGARRVIRDGKPLKLGGLTYDLLLVLAENAPSLVSYDDIAARVWKGRAVTPETIAQRAKMLRDALSDDAHSPRYVELVRGQGYRLVADVQPLEADAGLPTRRSWWPVAAVLALGAVLLGTIVSFLDRPAAGPSVAVLPFSDLSPAGDQRYLADGIAEELLSQLAKLDGLEVASRTESFYYREPAEDLQAVGRALGVSSILEGSVRKSDDEIRITVQLIDVGSGFHLWSENFDRQYEDLIQIQEDIASSVAGALGVKLRVGGVNEFHGAGTDNFDAYEAYLMGDYQKAIELDPDYAAAWGRRGLMIASTMHVNAPEDAPDIIARAREHVAKAIELDPESAIAHSDFATLIYATMDWEQAERSYARSMFLNRYPENIGHYANMMMRAGKSSEARQLHEERDAMISVPDNFGILRINVDLALEDFDAARQRAATMPEPSRAFANLTIELNVGSNATVRAAIDRLPKNGVDYQVLFGPVAELLDSPGEALQFLEQLLDEPGIMWPYKYHNIALLAAYLGYPEFALDTFLRELPYTTIRFGALWYPVMAEVRRLPRFNQFLTDVNLVDYWRNHGWSDFCRPLGEEDIVCQ